MRFLVIILLFLFPKISFAINCKKATNKIEKIICKDETLTEIDKTLNDVYNYTLKNSDKNKQIILKNSLKDLLKARNECVNIYNISFANQREIEIGLGESVKHKMNLIHFQLGCLHSWYTSVTKSLKLNAKYPELFTLPSYEDYVSRFPKNTPLPFKFEIMSGYDLETSERYITLYFPKTKNSFTAIESSNYFPGGVHGFTIGDKYYYSNKVEFGPINDSSYTCSVPIEEPIVIKGKIYLPETVSLTKKTDGLFGEYNESTAYASSRGYTPDCLLRIRNLTDQNDSYLVFTKDYLNIIQNDKEDDLFDEKPPKYDAKCAQDIVTKYSDVTGSEKECTEDNDIEYKCIFVKESQLGLIKKEITNRCLPNSQHTTLRQSQ